MASASLPADPSRHEGIDALRQLLRMAQDRYILRRLASCGPLARRLLLYQHEQAYLLCKGPTPRTSEPISDVIDFPYSGNALHPTQKPIEALEPLIHAFCPPAGIVLDPFCGSGSTLLAAHNTGRRYVGIEIDQAHYRTACLRLKKATGDIHVIEEAA